MRFKRVGQLPAVIPMKENESGTLIEWVMPLAFIACAGWLIWHAPNFILDFLKPEEGIAGQLSELMARKDVTPQMA